jgi:hypothetical protein
MEVINKGTLLLNWKEYESVDAPSMKDSFEDNAYYGQSKIVDYLNHGTETLVAFDNGKDFFSDKVISRNRSIMTDGEYSWSNTLAYYVKTYNLRLPKIFEDKVLSS